MNVEYVAHSGDDLLVVNTARVSFDKTSTEFTYRKDNPKGSDEGLIEYLATHNHWTPFAHPQITLRMKAPVPIRTQCFKHKQGFVENEESRRYISSTPELFIPATFRSKPEGSAKQGSEGVHPMSHAWAVSYTTQCQSAIKMYESMLADGVCPEQARLVLPQGVCVNWVWTGSLAAFARFVKQRTDPHAQEEIQDLALEVSAIIEPLFPNCWPLLIRK